MKTYIRTLLACLLLCAAMISIPVSCSKSEPERPAQGQQTQQPADPTLPQLTLDNAAALYAYAGESAKYTFKVTGQSAASAKISGGTCVNATIKAVEYNAQSGLGSVTVELDRGSLEAGNAKINLVVSVGSKSTKYDYSITPYYIKVKESVTLPGEAGKEVTAGLVLNTNIPNFVPVVSVNADWISYVDGKLKTLQDNRTGKEREAAILVNDSGNHFDGLSVKALQPTLGPTPVPGCVVFAEWPMKNACVAVADTNNDGEVSFEEAMNTKKLDISNKGIVDVKGLEEFRRLEELNCSGNKISKLIMDDPASFAFLRTIDARNNNNNLTINYSGCWIGDKLTLLHDDNVSFEYDQKEYTSTNRNLAGVELLQRHTKGRGIIIRFYSNEFYDIDFESGAVASIINKKIEDIFSIEPFKSLKNYFDILFIKTVKDINTSLEARNASPEYQEYFDDNTFYNTRKYIFSINITKTPTNPWTGATAGGFGELFSWNQGVRNIQIGYTRAPDIISRNTNQCLMHELGHSIGGLGDQYTTASGKPNCTKDKNNIPWQKFLDHPNYKDRVGIYELFEGYYYPSLNSFMGNNSLEYLFYDSPSRFELYKNIIQMANMPETSFNFSPNFKYTNEEIWDMFLDYDVINNNIPY